MTVAEARARVDSARAGDGTALGHALIELAEIEPIFGHRQAVVRALLREGAALVTDPTLEGRTLLRLAHVKLAEGDLEGVEQLVARAKERLAGDVDRTIEGDAMLARASIRRKDFTAAEAFLVAASERADTRAEPEANTPVARRAATITAFAWAELALEQQDWATAAERLRVVGDVLAGGSDELLELDFACHQARTLVALALGRVDEACATLRGAIAIAKAAGALEDELETRVQLAGFLVQRGDPVAFDEAERHLQIARDGAIDAGLDTIHMSALVGQAGLLAQKGQTHAALDRCLEIARRAAEKQDLPRYGAAVALMSHIYEQKGDLASAYRTLAEANASLRDTMGDQAARDVIRPHVEALADRIGPEKFRMIAERVNKAAHAKETFRRRNS
jgi:tetratricopeptide (TPR) repeat protein